MVIDVGRRATGESVWVSVRWMIDLLLALAYRRQADWCKGVAALVSAEVCGYRQEVCGYRQEVCGYRKMSKKRMHWHDGADA